MSELNTKAKFGRIKPCIHEFTQEEILQMANEGTFGLKVLVMLSKLLIEALGKEEAGKRIQKVRYAEFYNKGRNLAEELGNPKDLDSLVNNFLVKSPPWVNLLQPTYRTENKVILRTCNYCWEAEAIKKFADEEMQKFLAEYFCGQHDKGFVEGFNPKIKYQHIKHHLRGDPYCEYILELPEK